MCICTNKYELYTLLKMYNIIKKYINVLYHTPDTVLNKLYFPLFSL